jgi:hypothetical protein
LRKRVLYGSGAEYRVVGLFDHRRVRKFFRVHVVGAHAGQKHKWYALCLKQSCDIEAVTFHTA